MKLPAHPHEDHHCKGPLRLLTFCSLTVFLPCFLLMIPLYMRYHVLSDVTYTLGESDLVTVDKPISTFWCEGHELWMNATFHAYLLNKEPTISEDLQHFEMDKHVQLADDSLEYWGFFLLQGSKVILSVCSRYEGARLMVVKGTKNLKHCALLDKPTNSNIDSPWDDNVSAKAGEIKVEFHSGEKEEPSTVKGFGLRKPSKDQVLVQTVVLPAATNSSDDGRRSTDVNADDEREITTTLRPKRRLQKIRRINETTTESSFSSNRTKRDADDGPDEGYEYVDEGDGEDQHSGSYEEEAAPNPVPVGVEDELPSKPKNRKKFGPDDVIDEEDIRSSGSSYAKNLWTCYGGDTIITQSIIPSTGCSSQDSMMKYAVKMRTNHEITSTGYYYYIFYSDNDVVSNTIYAKFEISKVLYQLPNYTQSCLNATHCSLPLNFLSSEKVLLEVPLQDGVSDEDALAQMILISSCRPRLAVYFIFPVLILFTIICCAFI